MNVGDIILVVLIVLNLMLIVGHIIRLIFFNKVMNWFVLLLHVAAILFAAFVLSTRL